MRADRVGIHFVVSIYSPITCRCQIRHMSSFDYCMNATCLASGRQQGVDKSTDNSGRSLRDCGGPTASPSRTRRMLKLRHSHVLFVVSPESSANVMEGCQPSRLSVATALADVECVAWIRRLLQTTRIIKTLLCALIGVLQRNLLYFSTSRVFTSRGASEASRTSHQPTRTPRSVVRGAECHFETNAGVFSVATMERQRKTRGAQRTCGNSTCVFRRRENRDGSTCRCFSMIISNSGKRWIWRVVEGMEALGTWLDNRGCSEASMWHRISKANSILYAKKALFCDPKLPVKRRIDAFFSTCVPAALHGAGEWVYTQSMFQALRIWEL